ncbi:tetratricopeptide repeat protein [Pseudodonghicola sp.]|uniref:tetratricopeptide repeat protein n=1 Tax=Pseudodonghicola sp. TaxID=1969463 RepID=UPI003A96F25B
MAGGLEKLPALLAAGDWAAAEAVLKRAARARGAGAAIFYNLGKVYLEQGRAAPAMTWLTRATTADPRHARAWFELGRAALLAEDFASAERGFERALTLVPSDADARRNLGRVLLRRGGFTRARAIWTPLAGEAEADAAIYRAAAEAGDADAGDLRAVLLARPEARALALKTLVQTAKGSLPLQLP